MTNPHRVALYYAPEADDPLWQAGTSWLGRDPETDEFVAPPALLAAHSPDVTAEPAAYGLHGTLKPPFRLAQGVDYAAFVAGAAQLARGIRPFALPPLSLDLLDGFLALRESAPCLDLQALADLVVAAMDRMRAPPTEAELARRRRHPLAPEQGAMLALWGYPYVFQHFRFHITLTRRLTSEEAAVIRPLAEAHFRVALAEASPRWVRSLAVFTQEAPGAPFRLATRLPLGAMEQADLA